jgi:hypothetical protein
VLLHNDNYRPVLGPTKHPWALGRPIRLSYGELWHVVGPLFQRVLDGESIALEDSLLPLDRNGFLEEAYFTLSYSPLAAEDGSIAGVLGVHETTERVLAARRLRTLRELSGDMLAATPADAARIAIASLASNPADVPFALIYLADPEGHHARLAASVGIDELHTAAAIALDTTSVDPNAWSRRCSARASRNRPRISWQASIRGARSTSHTAPSSSSPPSTSPWRSRIRRRLKNDPSRARANVLLGETGRLEQRQVARCRPRA